MTRYFFDTRDGSQLIPDDEGLDLPSVEDARILASTALGEAAKDALPGSTAREIAIEVRDGLGPEPLLKASLRFKVEMLRSPL